MFSRWRPRETRTKQEEFLLHRLHRTRKLFAFLRDIRRELFDDAFQAELESMYRDTGAGDDPVPPALMAMALIMQAYLAVSDAEAVELTVVDLRWQMVLDRLGSDEPAFGQGTIVAFRNRLIAHDMDRRLLERTIELARRTKAFDWKKLPKDLRIAIDSAPLEGAGRVEDTVNLLGHAARNLVTCAASLLGWPFELVARRAGIPVLLESSVKKGLDIEWSDPAAKEAAIKDLTMQVASLTRWLEKNLADEIAKPPLKEHAEVLAQIVSQNLEPDPGGGGGSRIKEGVAQDRRISIEDPDMRHGRKSKSKRFNGYKRHLATDLDTTLIVACAVTPANRPEDEAAPQLKSDVEKMQRRIQEVHIDRGYITSPVVREVLDAGGVVLCKPWVPRNGERFTKADFKINLRDMTITCPAGEVEQIDLGADVEFNPEACARCPSRAACTTAGRGHGRSVSIADDEVLQQRLRKLTATKRGRIRLRERVTIEHNLAHLCRRQGRRARYLGTRKNLLDVRRAAVVQNLETVHRQLEPAVAERRKAA
ncbi:MAG: IS1182 family transposase [Actinomycetota bacterium]